MSFSIGLVFFFVLHSLVDTVYKKKNSVYQVIPFSLYFPTDRYIEILLNFVCFVKSPLLSILMTCQILPCVCHITHAHWHWLRFQAIIKTKMDFFFCSIFFVCTREIKRKSLRLFLQASFSNHKINKERQNKLSIPKKKKCVFYQFFLFIRT